MRVSWTPETLVEFEDDIARRFLAKEILSPVHLAGGNERQLIDIFERLVQPDDWVCCQWRSHYHCLLKGVPEAEAKEAILAGRSISLCFKEQRVISSGIAGGIVPIAVGLALGIKMRSEDVTGIRLGGLVGSRKVVCFIGDMTARMGSVMEAMDYAAGHQLPILFVIEDNGLSVSTPTERVWGKPSGFLPGVGTVRYKYKMTRPHVGCGQWVKF